MKAVLDIFECQGGPFVWDLAVALAYLAISVPDLENDLDDYLRVAANAYTERMPDVLPEFGDIESFMVSPAPKLESEELPVARLRV